MEPCKAYKAVVASVFKYLIVVVGCYLTFICALDIAYFFWSDTINDLILSLEFPFLNQLQGVLSVCASLFLVFLLLGLACVLVYFGTEMKRKGRRKEFDFSEIVVPKKKKNFKKQYLSYERSFLRLLSKHPKESTYASIFATAILTPQCLFRYIDERVETFTRSISITTNMEIALPYALREKPFILPLVMYQCGDVPNAIVIKDASGASISSLNYQESVEYTLSVLQKYCPSLSSLPHIKERLRTYLFFGGTVDSLEAIRDRVKEAKEIVKALDLEISKNSSGKKDNIKIVRQLLIKLARSYPICIRCAPVENVSNSQVQNDRPLEYMSQQTRSLSISFSHRLSLVRVNSCKKPKLLSRLENFFIRRPMTIYYDLENADRGQSYHLQMKGRDNSYYSFGRLQRIGAQAAKATADTFGLQRRLGQRHARIASQNGSGFNNLSYMFCYSQRSMTYHHIALIVLVTELIAVVMIFSSTAGVNIFADGLNITEDNPLYILIGQMGVMNSAAIVNSSGENGAVSVVVTLVVALAGIVSAWVTDKNNSEREAEIAPKIASWLGILVAIAIGLFLFSDGPAQLFLTAFLLVGFAVLATGVVWLFTSLCISKSKYNSFKKEDVIIDVAPEQEDSSNSDSADCNSLDCDNCPGDKSKKYCAKVQEACKDEDIYWSPGWRAKSAYFYPITEDENLNNEEIRRDFCSNPNYVRDDLVF